MTVSTLYAHDPSTLRDLLAFHLPYSLPLYGIIASNDTTCLEPFYATFPPDAIPLSLTLKDVDTTPTPPRDSLASDSSIWTIITPLPSPSQHQTRIFNSSENPILRASLPPAEVALAREQVLSVVQRYVRDVDQDMINVGGVNSLWSGALEDRWGLQGVEKRKMYGSWVKRVMSSGSREERSWLARDGSLADGKDGEGGTATGTRLSIEEGRVEDVISFIDNTDIKRSNEYYTSRLPCSTILRSSTLSPSSSTSSASRPSATEIAAQVMTHGDGTIGSLYTYPAFRRRGLAKQIVQAHMESGRGVVRGRRGGSASRNERGGIDDGEEVDGWAWTNIAVDNEASIGMFESCGFERMWEGAWVYKPVSLGE